MQIKNELVINLNQFIINHQVARAGLNCVKLKLTSVRSDPGAPRRPRQRRRGLAVRHGDQRRRDVRRNAGRRLPATGQRRAARRPGRPPLGVRGADAGGPTGRRPILPVDARLQNESFDASDAHDTFSDRGPPPPPPPHGAAAWTAPRPLAPDDDGGCCCWYSLLLIMVVASLSLTTLLPAAGLGPGDGDDLRAAPAPAATLDDATGDDITAR